jgi:hypothetical protein
MLEDLQTEAAKIRAGKPTPSDSHGLEDEFGFEGARKSGSIKSSGSTAQSPPGAAGDNSSALTTDRCSCCPDMLSLTTTFASLQISYMQSTHLNPSDDLNGSLSEHNKLLEQSFLR